MPKSPCIGCEFEFADKNNPTCRECDRRVEYVALVEEEMNIEHSPATQGIGRASRMKKIEIEETAEVRIKECPIKGCDKGIYCRGLCKNHFQQWYKGYIDHPVFGAYTVAQPKKHSLKKRGEQIMDKDKTESKGAEGRGQRSVGAGSSRREIEGEKAALPPLVAVQMSLYPEIQKVVFDTAKKSFLPVEHVIITLLGEALAARKERGGHDEY